MLLNKTWFRLVISLLGGGVISETIHISTGDLNRPQTSNLSLLFAIVIYAVLTLIVMRRRKNQKSKEAQDF